MRDQKYWQLVGGSPLMRPVSILCNISICPSFTSSSFSHLDFQRQNSCLSLSKLRISSSTSGFGGDTGLKSEVGLGLVVVGKTKFLACMDFLWEGAGGSLQSSFSTEPLACTLPRWLGLPSGIQMRNSRFDQRECLPSGIFFYACCLDPCGSVLNCSRSSSTRNSSNSMTLG